MSGAPVSKLVDGLAAGKREAVAAALNLIDDQRPESRSAALDLLDRLPDDARTERSRRLGLTGAPGAGKSTLLDALIDALRKRDLTIGIIAVDPSSPHSGGALLGDRMRLGSSARDRGVFMRSMAARSRLGGLADATHAGVAILSSVFDVVFVETVGVGQSESEVARLVDSLIFVAQPGAGDTIQFMKAGLLEFPDLFAVNKADLGALAERTRAELSAGLDLGRSRATGWTAPVVLTSARDRSGIHELIAALDHHRTWLEESGELARRRRQGCNAFVCDALRRRYGSYGVEQLGGETGLQERLQRTPAPSPFRLMHEIGSEIEAALGSA